jgi:hypothetical protein
MDYKKAESSTSVWGVPKVKVGVQTLLVDAYSKGLLDSNTEGDGRLEALASATTRGEVLSVIRDIPNKVKDSYMSFEVEADEASREEYYVSLAGDRRVWGVPSLIHQAREIVRNAAVTENLDPVTCKRIEDALIKAKTRGDVFIASSAVPTSVKDHSLDSSYPDDSRQQAYREEAEDTTPWNLPALRARGTHLLEQAFFDDALDEDNYRFKIETLMAARTRGEIFAALAEVPSSVKDSFFGELSPGGNSTGKPANSLQSSSTKKTSTKKKRGMKGIIVTSAAILVVSGILGILSAKAWGRDSTGPKDAHEPTAPVIAEEPVHQPPVEVVEVVMDEELIPVASIVLPKAMQLAPGKTQRLAPTVSPVNATDASIDWTSSSPGIVAVGTDGTVSAKSSGTAIITATATDGSGITGVCGVTVSAPAPVPALPARQEVYVIEDFERQAVQVESYRNDSLTLHPSVIGGEHVLLLEGLEKAGLNNEAYYHNRVGIKIPPGSFQKLKIMVYLPASLCSNSQVILARLMPVLNNWDVQLPLKTITGVQLKRIGNTGWAAAELAFDLPSEDIYSLLFLMSLGNITMDQEVSAALGRPQLERRVK